MTEIFWDRHPKAPISDPQQHVLKRGPFDTLRRLPNAGLSVQLAEDGVAVTMVFADEQTDHPKLQMSFGCNLTADRARRLGELLIAAADHLSQPVAPLPLVRPGERLTHLNHGAIQ